MNALVFGALKGAMKDELGQIDWLIAKVAATLATGPAWTPPILRLQRPSREDWLGFPRHP
jgi:hypothetical protein